MPKKTIKRTVKKIVPETEVEVEIEEEVDETDEPIVQDNSEDKKELAELEALRDGLARRQIACDSRLQVLIEQLENKLK